MGWQGSGGQLCTCLFQLLEAVHIPGSLLCITPNSASVITSPSLTLRLLPPSVTCKNPCNYIGPTWIIQTNFPIFSSLITFVKSRLPHKVTSSQVPGIRMWISFFFFLRGSVIHLSQWMSFCLPEAASTRMTGMIFHDLGH